MEYKKYKSYYLSHLGWELSLFWKNTLKVRRRKGYELGGEFSFNKYLLRSYYARLSWLLVSISKQNPRDSLQWSLQSGERRQTTTDNYLEDEIQEEGEEISYVTIWETVFEVETAASTKTQDGSMPVSPESSKEAQMSRVEGMSQSGGRWGWEMTLHIFTGLSGTNKDLTAEMLSFE